MNLIPLGTGLSGGSWAWLYLVYLAMGLLALGTIASLVLSGYLLLSSRRPRRLWPAVASLVFAALVAGCLLVGAFTLHRNAPHDQNPYCLVAAAVVMAAAVPAAWSWWDRSGGEGDRAAGEDGGSA
ncbi:MAG: hypothetical protein OER86_11475 [Phycisphaerae bacterium]|nr:hypothetical protein [Phycisphaerae bacterium]